MPSTTEPARLIRVVPWLVALLGLAVPLIAGGGAGWPYVVGWLVVLLFIALVRPLARADRRNRIAFGVLAIVLLVVPGLVVGGLYLVPATLVWLGIEVASRPRRAALINRVG